MGNDIKKAPYTSTNIKYLNSSKSSKSAVDKFTNLWKTFWDSESVENLELFLISQPFLQFIKGMIILESQGIVPQKNLAKKISEHNGSYIDWIFSKNFITGNEFKYFRNFGAADIENILLIKLENTKNYIKKNTSHIDTGFGVMEVVRFRTPLLEILELQEIFELQEKPITKSSYDPIEPRSKNSCNVVKDLIDEQYLIEHVKKIKFSRENRPEIQLNRDKKLIEDVTGGKWKEIYEECKSCASRLLYLLHEIRKLNSGRLKPVIDGISGNSEMLPQIPWSNRGYRIDILYDEFFDLEKDAARWFKNENDSFSLDIPCTISELLSYLIFNSSTKNKDTLSCFYSWSIKTLTSLSILQISGDTPGKRLAFSHFSPLLLSAQFLKITNNIRKSRNIFDIFTYKIISKFIVQHESTVENTHKIIESIRIVEESDHVQLVKFLSENIKKRNHIAIPASQKDKNKLLIFRLVSLLNLLLSLDVIDESDAFGIDNITAGLKSILSTSENNVKIPCNNPKKKSRTGKSDPIHSLTLFGKRTLYFEGSPTNESPAIPTTHSIYWQELFIHIKSGLNPCFDQRFYIESRRNISSTILKLIKLPTEFSA